MRSSACQKEYGDERRDEINSVVSRYVSAITEENTIWRKWMKRESSACRRKEERFAGGAQQRNAGTVLFCVPHGSRKHCDTGRTAALLLDETFAMYDDDRLRQTLRLLAADGTQTILFTCQRREQKLLEELGISYHMIEL